MNTGTYEIKYAYPFSRMAEQLRNKATGCFYVELEGKLSGGAFQSLEDAEEYAEGTGYFPSKYSMNTYGKV